MLILGLTQLNLQAHELTALLKRDSLTQTEMQSLVAVINKMKDLDNTGLTIYPGAVKDVRPLTDTEYQNLQTIAADVSKLMRSIGAGHYDDYVNLVFDWDGTGGHGTHAKEVFSGAADALDRLLKNKQIVADVMRKSDVWCCAGLTNSSQMALPESIIASLSDTRRNGDAFLTLVHESTHALKKGATTDVFYENHEGFKIANPETKKSTADYYKVVVRHIAQNRGLPFIPMSIDAHLSTARSKELMTAAAMADKLVSGAWITAMRIHDTVLEMANNPSNYHTFSGKYEKWLNSASRLMGLTLHREDELIIHSWTSKTPMKISAIDLSTMDNKIAILGACNGKGKYIMTEPVNTLIANEFVDYVLRGILTMCAPGQKFSKSRDKDIKVIKILGNLHESVSGKNGLLGFDELPAS